MELAHTNVEASMSDFYASEYIDKLDELKININERQAVAQSAAAALGRKTDELIIAAMDAGANGTQIHDTGSALEKADLLLCSKPLVRLMFPKMVSAISPCRPQVLLTCLRSTSLHRLTTLVLKTCPSQVA
jgi:hypothetical protein